MYPLDVKNALCNGGRWVWKGLKVGKESPGRAHPGSQWFQSLYITSCFPEAGRRLSPWVVLPGPPLLSQLSALLLLFGQSVFVHQIT